MVYKLLFFLKSLCWKVVLIHMVQCKPISRLMPTFQRPQLPGIERKVKKAKIHPADSPGVPLYKTERSV